MKQKTIIMILLVCVFLIGIQGLSWGDHHDCRTSITASPVEPQPGEAVTISYFAFAPAGCTDPSDYPQCCTNAIPCVNSSYIIEHTPPPAGTPTKVLKAETFDNAGMQSKTWSGSITIPPEDLTTGVHTFSVVVYGLATPCNHSSFATVVVGCPDPEDPGSSGSHSGNADGVGEDDCNDPCPTDPNDECVCPEGSEKETPGICGCDTEDTDGDYDGVPDCIDDCPYNPNQAVEGSGCGVGTNTNPNTPPDNNQGAGGGGGGQGGQGEDPPDENEGGSCDKTQGNPILIYSANNYEKFNDIYFSSAFTGGFPFIRSYNSQSVLTGPLGYGWTHTYNASLYINTSTSLITMEILDATGRGFYFEQEAEGSSHYVGQDNERTTVDVDEGIYIWHRLDGTDFYFYSTGKLKSISDKSGNQLNLIYEEGGSDRLESVTDSATGRSIVFHYYPTGHASEGLLEYISGPVTTAVSDGIWVTYTYDTNSNLETVTYADGSGYIYVYNDPNDIHNLTQKKNISGSILSSWTYDDKDRAVGNVTRDGKSVEIDYDTYSMYGKIKVTDENDNIKMIKLTNIGWNYRISNISNASGCSSCGSDLVRIDYNDNMRITEKEFANGRIDKFNNFDSNNNAQTVTEALGTDDQRIIEYTYHPELITKKLSRKEKSVLDDGQGDTEYKETIWDYDDDYNDISNENPTKMIHRIIEKGYTYEKNNPGTIVPYEYITTYTYDTNNQLNSVDGPLSGSGDTTFITYDPTTRELLTLTSPIIGTTTYTYDAVGNVESITDTNNVLTTLTYDGRNRLLTNTTNGVTRTTNYNLDGKIDTVTDGEGRTLDYQYNVSGFVEKVVDPLGNYLYYGYDDKQNRNEVSFYDSTDVRSRYLRYSYDGNPADPEKHPPGKLWKEINPDDTFTEYSYDSMGNLSSVKDALNNVTMYSYDKFNRIKSVTQPGSVETKYEYDFHSNLTKIIDAKNHETTYKKDDLGRLIETVSPDTGTTSYTYDEAGNLSSKTFNSGRKETFSYDDLNRIIGIAYSDSSQMVSYTYDAFEAGMNYGKGRLTGMTDKTGTYSYTYDEKGNLIEETKLINGLTYITSYTYDNTSKITSITYPSGRLITYTPDTAGNINSISSNLDGILVDNISYKPFGPMTGLTYGNGLILSRSFNLKYQIENITTSGNVMGLTYTPDAVGNISTIINNLDPSRSQSFGYDDLYRLASAQGVYGSIIFTYDNVGNRLTKEVGSQTDSYAYQTGTNRLHSITGANPRNYVVDTDGNIAELKKTQNGSAFKQQINYIHNANGQRTKKEVNGSITVYHYDLNGNLISETDHLGNLIRDYIYLNGQPLNSVDSFSDVYYYHNDHLGTPQKMTDSTGIIVWAIDYNPFGETNITVDTIKNNLRFPGQYYDEETGLHYNMNRYYDPHTGRYMRADPIGLSAGINLYTYAFNNPVNTKDPWGLFSVKDAIHHYFFGDGRDVHLSFGEIDVGLEPRDFPGFDLLLEMYYKQEVTVFVDLSNYVDIGGWAGNINYRLNGTFKSDECEWEFSGYVGADPNYFDFNSKPWGDRPLIDEIVTQMIGKFGPMLGGENYLIHFHGIRSVYDSGKW